MFSQTLRRAKALIEDPKRFTSRRYGSVDLQGNSSYCMLGAISRVEYGTSHMFENARSGNAWKYVIQATNELFSFGPVKRFRALVLIGPEIVIWSKRKGHSRAMRIMDRAIELAEADEIAKAKLADEAELIAQGGKTEDRVAA